MKFIKFILKKYIMFTSIIACLLISSILWVTIEWSSYYEGKLSEIETESSIIFDIVTDIIKHDNELVKQLSIDEKYKNELNLRKFLQSIYKKNYIFQFNNIINLNAYEYAEEKLKIFDNLYKKHWLEVKDSRENILIQTRYKYNGSNSWDDKYFEEKQIIKEVTIENESYTYIYGCKYRPYWYISLIRNITLFTFPDAIFNINFSWNKWFEDTFIKVENWEQIYSFWIIFIILISIIPFALKNIYDLYKAAKLLKYRYKSYRIVLRRLKKQFDEKIESLSSQTNELSIADFVQKKKELENQYIQQLKDIKSNYSKQMSDIRAGFSNYYDNSEKSLLRYKKIIAQQKSEINEMFTKLKEHNIQYDPYKFTDFKFRSKASILILGGEGSISINDAENILKSFGLYNNTNIKWIAYRDMDRFDITKYQNTKNFSDIIVGAIPHSLPNVPEQNLVSHLKNNSSLYPQYQILRNGTDGDLLQVTKNNLKEAIKNSAKYKWLLEQQMLNTYK